MTIKVIMKEKSTTPGYSYGKICHDITSSKPMTVFTDDGLLTIVRGTGNKKITVFGTPIHQIDHWLVID